EVCAPIHDAVLICTRLDRLNADIAKMRAAMAEASRAVLSGFELGTDANVICWPDRYSDPRGAVMWSRIIKLSIPEHVRCSALSMTIRVTWRNCDWTRN